MLEYQKNELLARIDERVKAIKDRIDEDVPEIKEHLQNLNGQVSRNKVDCKVNRATIAILTLVVLGIIGALLRINGVV